MSKEVLQKTDIIKTPKIYEDLVLENRNLLTELELAYTNMEMILAESTKEKQITYNELQNKVKLLENLYNELSKKENMLIHMEKLSSIGEFITELIHELRNPLHAMSLQVQLALIKGVTTEAQKRFNTIADLIKNMSTLLDRFRSMAYKGKEDFKHFDLNQNVAECIETIEIIKPKYINIESELCDQSLMVKGDPYQTNQIFLNLAKNAFDAMKDHGKELMVQSRKVDSAFVRNNDEINCTYCRKKNEWKKIIDETAFFALIKFIDHGNGMPNELLKQIFEPFFTTKERGKGTGLGLCICSDIALRHGGNLAVTSELHQGTTFHVVFPLESES